MTSNLMPISQVIDFYYAEAIASETKQARNWRAGEKLVEDAAILRDKLADSLAPALYNYLIVACYGEAEHATWGSTGIRFKDSGNYRRALSFKPESMIETLRCIFATQHWEGGFGGKKWAKICEELGKVGTMPKVAWVDHLIDLEHNGGSAFDKHDEARVANVFINVAIQYFLDFKAREDILTDKPPRILQFESLWKSKLPYATELMTRDTKDLIARYYTVYHNKSIPTWFVRTTKDRPIIPYAPPKIGRREVKIGDLIVPNHVKVNKKGNLVEDDDVWYDNYNSIA